MTDFCNTELVADSNEKYIEALEILENTTKDYEYYTNEVEKLNVFTTVNEQCSYFISFDDI